MCPMLWKRVIKKERGSFVLEGTIVFPVFLIIVIAFMALIQVGSLSTYFRQKGEVATIEIASRYLIGEAIFDTTILSSLDDGFGLSESGFKKELLKIPMLREEFLKVTIDLNGDNITICIVYEMPFLFNQQYRIEERIVRQGW